VLTFSRYCPNFAVVRDLIQQTTIEMSRPS
jgi:hypothetical protein